MTDSLKLYPSPDSCEYCYGREVVPSMLEATVYLKDVEYDSECNVCGAKATHTWGKDTPVTSLGYMAIDEVRLEKAHPVVVYEEVK